jgi:hypothetical protein
LTPASFLQEAPPIMKETRRFHEHGRIPESLKSNMLMALVEVSRKSKIIVSQNEEFMIAALLMCEGAVFWEISRTPAVLFCH